MGAKQFTCEEAEDHTIRQRVCRGKDLSDAAFQIVLTAAREFMRKAEMMNPLDAIDVDKTTVSDLSDCTPASSHKRKKKVTCEPQKRFQLNPSQANLSRQGDFQEQQQQAEIFAMATCHYYQERQKKNGMSAHKVAELYNNEHNVNISKQTLQEYVQNGQVGMPLGRKGPAPGKLSEGTLNTLVEAFESYSKLNQINQAGHLNTHLGYLEVVQDVVRPLLPRIGPNLVNQLLKRTSIDFKGKVAIPMEERRTRWTTYSKLNMWFNQWETDLVDLGFAYRQEDGSVVIPPKQLGRIINIDETALSLDGANGRCGGRPRVQFYHSSIPVSHRRTSKSSMTITMITGSSAAGEAIAPHFQFPTKAKPENAKLNIDILTKMKKVEGVFGKPKLMSFPTTFQMNEKAGMNEIEFEKYVEDNIIRLYPDAADLPGKRVMLKVDSGPG